MTDPLPRLRLLEILQIEKEDGGAFLLRDPEGYSDEELILSEPALFIAAHADGNHSLEDLRESFDRRYGETPDPGEIEGLIDRLDAAYMLETDTFFTHRDEMRRTFKDAAERPAEHLGKSYPAAADEAGDAMREFFEKAATIEEDGDRPRGRLSGVVAPHIDLRVGGPCTALGYSLIADAESVETVVVLGTAHGCPHPAWIVSDKPYQTPLGTVPVDTELQGRLAAAACGDPDDEYYHRKEHSIEFQALFLAWLREQGRDIKMVPVLCGSLRAGDEQEEPEAPPENDPFLAELGRVVREHGDRVLLLAAADLAHVGVRFGDSRPLEESHLKLLDTKDRQTLETVCRGDARGFFQSVMEANDPRRICGLSPIYALLSGLGESRGKLLRYEQAIDPTGTVTYASLGLWN